MKAKADVNIDLADKKTVLHFASGHVLKVLLETKGVDVKACDINGTTTLHLAAHAHFDRVGSGGLRMHVRAGADIGAQDNTGFTPLHIVSMHLREGAVGIFLECGVDMTIRAFRKGNTAEKIIGAKFIWPLTSAKRKPQAFSI